MKKIQIFLVKFTFRWIVPIVFCSKRKRKIGTKSEKFLVCAHAMVFAYLIVHENAVKFCVHPVDFSGINNFNDENSQRKCETRSNPKLKKSVWKCKFTGFLFFFIDNVFFPIELSDRGVIFFRLQSKIVLYS